jgi:hypothetical protein
MPRRRDRVRQRRWLLTWHNITGRLGSSAEPQWPWREEFTNYQCTRCVGHLVPGWWRATTDSELFVFTFGSGCDYGLNKTMEYWV